MLTKRKLKALIKDRLDGGRFPHDDSKFDGRDVDIVLDMAYNHVMMAEYAQNRTEGRQTVQGYYIIPFKNVDIKKNPDTHEWYSDLPARPMSLPQNKGVQGVYPMEDIKTPMIQHEVGQAHVYQHLEAGLITDHNEYRIEGLRIVYERFKKAWRQKLNSTAKKDKCTVLIRMVPSIESFTDEDILPIPAGREMMMVEVALEFFLGKRNIPEDNLNDQVPN